MPINKLKRLSNPRIRRRLKIALSIWIGAMLLAASYKVVYDMGYFDAKSLATAKMASGPLVPAPKLSLDAAQQIVTGALKEDPNNPQTMVLQVLDDDRKLSTIVVDINKQQRVAWIIDMRMFFIANVFNSDGFNLTKGFEKQYEVTRGIR